MTSSLSPPTIKKQKASQTSKASLKPTFWWLKSKWMRNIRLKFPLWYTRAPSGLTSHCCQANDESRSCPILTLSTDGSPYLENFHVAEEGNCKLLESVTCLVVLLPALRLIPVRKNSTLSYPSQKETPHRGTPGLEQQDTPSWGQQLARQEEHWT